MKQQGAHLPTNEKESKERGNEMLTLRLQTVPAVVALGAGEIPSQPDLPH